MSHICSTVKAEEHQQGTHICLVRDSWFRTQGGNTDEKANSLFAWLNFTPIFFSILPHSGKEDPVSSSHTVSASPSPSEEGLFTLPLFLHGIPQTALY